MEEKENERASGVDDGGVWYSTLSTRQKNPQKTSLVHSNSDSVKRRRILERM